MFSARLNLLWLLAAFFARGLPAADAASVSGTVVNEATGAPLHMALVMISTTGQKPLDATVYTDGKGAFSFDVPPGRYYLSASENGYARTWFGAATQDVAPAVMTVRAGEVRQGIRLRLPPLAAISGTVVDQDNDPVAGARVMLLRPGFSRGRPVRIPRSESRSTDRGEFRLYGIQPGQYYLLVTTMQGFAASGAIRSQVSLGDPAPDTTWVPTFYPGVASLADATLLDVRAGADMGNIVLRMNAQEAAWVNGTVELPEGVSAAGGIMVQFSSEDEAGMPSMRMGFGTSGSEKNKFQGIRLTPGRYKVTASIQGGGDEYRSSEEFEFHSGRQEITVHLTKPVRLAGHLTLEGSSAGDLSKAEIVLNSPQPGTPDLTANVRADGSFEFPAVSSGVWDIGVRPIPKGGYIKSMMLGDQDVLTTEMTIGPQTTAPLNIIVSARAAVVSGTVKQPEDNLADLTGQPRARILLAPAGRFSDVLSFYHSTNSDENGRFTLHGVTPGSYKIFALDRLKAQAWWDPAFMKRIDALGKPLEIHEGEQVSVDLDVKPLPPDPEEP